MVYHDNSIICRETGEQLIGIMDDCFKINELYCDNKALREFKENVEKIIRDMYHTEKTTFGKTTIKNIAELLLGVEL